MLSSLIALALSPACSEYDLKRPDDATGAVEDTAPPIEYTPEDPRLRITPDPLEFGYVGLGCEDVETITLENAGGALLRITDISQDSDTFWLRAIPDLPLTLEPGETVELEVGFSPAAETTYSGDLVVASNDPAGVKRGEQIGLGTQEATEQLETWDIPTNIATDILFSVDTSCSMTTDLIEMYLNFDSFIALLDGLTGDWQVAVAKGDDGCREGSVITPATPDLESAFQSAIFAFQWDDDYTEALLSVNEAAIQETDPGECNYGFMRDDAMLHIIDISDEPEQSFEETGRTWQELVDSIIAKKGDPALTTISAVAGPVPGGCDDASPGTGYAEAVDYTGGVFLSVCDPWYNLSNLELLAEASVSQRRFELELPAIESSIAVEVNGTDRSDWNYDAAANAVIILGSAPTSGDRVAIDYLSEEACAR